MIEDDEVGIPLTAHSFCRAIDKKIEKLMEHLSSGSIDNLESYKAITGRIYAYRDAREILLNKNKAK